MVPKKLQKSPFLYFAPSVITFQQSGHTLTRDKAYYVCSQKQKGKCKLPEHTLKARNLERSFARFAKKFEIPHAEKETILIKKVLGKIMHDQVDDWIESDAFNEIFEASTEMMKEDIKTGNTKEFNKNAKEAIKSLDDATNTATEYLAGIMTGVAITFASRKISEADAGMTLAWLSEKIYLSDKGKIVNLKLYLVGDFIFQFFRQNITGYGKPFKYILSPRAFENLNYRDVAKKIRRGDIKETLIPPLHFGRAMVTMTNNIFANTFRRNPKKLLESLQYLENSAMGYMTRHLFNTFKNPRQK